MTINFNNFIPPYAPSKTPPEGIPPNTPDHLEDNYLDWRHIQEVTGSRSPNAVGFSPEGAKASSKYIIGNQLLDRYCTYMVGWSDVYPSKGLNATFSPDYSGINRTLPIAHPRYPWLFASAVENVQGNSYVRASDLSSQGGLPIPNKGMLSPKLPTYAEYQDYEVSVAFGARNYHVIPNSTIASGSEFPENNIIYYFPDSSTTSNFSWDSAYVGKVWPEWDRFTFLRVEPRSEYLTAEKNTMFFYDPSGSIATVNGTVPQIPGNIKIPYPSQSITLQWFNVPYRFITGEGVYDADGRPTTLTPLQLGLNTVNQFYFLGRPAGTLLFESVKVASIGTRPFPEYIEYPVGSGKYSFRQLRVCDLDLTFIYRNPPPGVNYEAILKEKKIETLPGQKGILQGNNVLAGHNLLPNARNGKYYAGVYTTKIADPGGNNPSDYAPDFRKQVMLYPSFPHQLLFTDPAYTCPAIAGIGRHN